MIFYALHILLLSLQAPYIDTQNIFIFLIKGIEKILIVVYNVYANSFTVCCINTVYSNTFHNVRRRNIVYTNTLHNVRQRNIVYQPSVQCRGFSFKEDIMIERGLYYSTPEFSQLIKSVGGEWNDPKHRPIVCLVKSTENENLYWAIPMGNWNHRTPEQQARLLSYLNLPSRDIRSCYYHLGRTTNQSIFFISDAIPIIDKYIDSEHVGADKKHFVIKNPKLIAELERKLFRILAVENADKNHFRQHITDIKNELLAELDKR